MFKINDKEVDVIKFPDGTCKVELNYDEQLSNPINELTWLYDGDEEVFQLINIAKLLESNECRLHRMFLTIPYFPNARMDRVKNKATESFTLKVFCELLKRIGFQHIRVFDPHSIITEMLLDDVISPYPFEHEDIFDKVSYRLNNDFILFYPDEGARKRYDYKMPFLCGYKNRDWETGKIISLEVVGDKELVKGKDILIMDDISSYGRTFLHSAKKLKELGAKDVYLFVSHCENSILEGELYKSGLIKKVFTTNSIYRGNDPWVEIVHKF